PVTTDSKMGATRHGKCIRWYPARYCTDRRSHPGISLGCAVRVSGKEAGKGGDPMMHPSRRLSGVSRLIALSFSFIFMALAGASPGLAEFALLHPKKDSTLIENGGGTLGNGSGPAFFAGGNSSKADNFRPALPALDLSATI